jgi:hypothetical protein
MPNSGKPEFGWGGIRKLIANPLDGGAAGGEPKKKEK